MAPTIRAPLWPVALVLRLLIAGFLVFGPATDEPSELAGWDAERFQEIVDRTGAAWVDQPVEYPPGSVVVLDRLAGDDLVSTHRRLVALSVVVDLAMAAALWWRLGSAPARAFLWLGLPLVPLGYQRLDTLVTALALVGALALLTDTTTGAGQWWWLWRRGWRQGQDRHPPAWAVDAVAAITIAAGTLTKIWPAVLVVAAVSVGRWRAAVGAAALTAAGGGAWLLAAGIGLEPVDQVLSLRGATGWHVESLPGSLVALFTDDPTRLELDAFRVGSLRPAVVTAGRVVALALMALLAAAPRRSGPPDRSVSDLALVTLGAVGAMLITAPLLSPQFLVWTTPWAAMLVVERHGRYAVVPRSGVVVGLVAVSVVLTGATLTAFGPDGLATTVPALLLTVRNLALIALTIACALARWADPAVEPVRPSGTSTGMPVGEPAHRPTSASS